MPEDARTVNLSLRALLLECRLRFEKADIPNPLAEAKKIISLCTDIHPECIEETVRYQTNLESVQNIERCIALREARTPITVIFGAVDFCDVKIQTMPQVFGPTPETEAMVQHAIVLFENRKETIRILDIGTGGGCILLALLKALPNSTGLGLDVNEQAVQLALTNANANNVSTRVEFKINDWTCGVDEQFDLIICNPPRVATQDIQYLMPEMRDYAPTLSIDGGDDGLIFFKRMITDFSRLLKNDGIGICQLGGVYADRVATLYAKTNLFNIDIYSDYLGRPCCLGVRKKEGRLFSFLHSWMRRI